MTPFRANPDYARWGAVAKLIHQAFAYMEPILGHPARATHVTRDQLATAARDGTAFVIEADANPVGCLFTRASRDVPGALYLGWLAVDQAQRRHGLGARLLATAEDHARAQGHPALTLDTGEALTDLCRYFRNAGFERRAADPASGVVTFVKPLHPVASGAKDVP